MPLGCYTVGSHSYLLCFIPCLFQHALLTVCTITSLFYLRYQRLCWSMAWNHIQSSKMLKFFSVLSCFIVVIYDFLIFCFEFINFLATLHSCHFQEAAKNCWFLLHPFSCSCTLSSPYLWVFVCKALSNLLIGPSDPVNAGYHPMYDTDSCVGRCAALN